MSKSGCLSLANRFCVHTAKHKRIVFYIGGMHYFFILENENLA